MLWVAPNTSVNQWVCCNLCWVSLNVSLGVFRKVVLYLLDNLRGEGVFNGSHGKR